MNLRIRIADDEELIRKSLVKLLSAEGYEVDAVGSAAEVLESVRNDPPTHSQLFDVGLRGRKDVKSASVIEAIAELDERLVPAAVMPPQHSLVRTAGAKESQNALDIRSR